MAAFGIEQWLERGEGFSVYFNFFSRISPVCVKDGELGLRAPLRGLTKLKPMPGTVGFVVTIIGTVTFDGASEGSTWGSISKQVQDFFHSVGFSFATSIELADTLGLLAGIALIAGIYSLGIAGVRSVDRRPFSVDANTYVHTLVPIAAAYVIAHYFSFLVFNGQAMIYLASDPLGQWIEHLRDGQPGDRLLARLGDRHLVRAGRRAGDRARRRPGAGARPRARHLRQRARGNAFAVLDARRDGRLYDIRTLVTLAGEQLERKNDGLSKGSKRTGTGTAPGAGGRLGGGRTAAAPDHDDRLIIAGAAVVILVVAIAISQSGNKGGDASNITGRLRGRTRR